MNIEAAMYTAVRKPGIWSTIGAFEARQRSDMFAYITHFHSRERAQKGWNEWKYNSYLLYLFSCKKRSKDRGYT